MNVYRPNEDPRGMRITVLEGLLRQWLGWKKLDLVKRRELRMHTRRMLGIQSPVSSEHRRETSAEKSRRLGLNKQSSKGKGKIIKPGDDSS